MFDRIPTFSPQARLWLEAPAFKQMGLLFSSDTLFDVAYVRAYLRTHLPTSLHAFHQTDGADYQFFEFWSADQEAILLASQEVAKALGLDLGRTAPDPDLLIANAQEGLSQFPATYDVYTAHKKHFAKRRTR